jgi:hypothetical protein
MIECIFGWGKQHGTMRKTKHRDVLRVAADFMLNLIAYNLIRIPKPGCGVGKPLLIPLIPPKMRLE